MRKYLIYLHPVFFTALIPLITYLNNFREVFPNEVPVAVLLMYLHSAALFAFASLFTFRRWGKTVLLTSFLILISLFFIVSDKFNTNYPFSGMCALLLIAGFLTWKLPQTWRLHALLSIVGAALVTYNSVSLFTQYRASTLRATLPNVITTPLHPNDNLPHIIYIVPDRYPSHETAKNLFETDNRSFLDGLKERGFHVADTSYANYTKTFQALAALFNMQYLTPFAEKGKRHDRSYIPIIRLLRDSEVFRSLKQADYRILHMGNFWEPTRHNDYEDENFSDTSPLRRFSAFQMQLLQLSPLGTLFIDHAVLDLKNFIRGCELIKQQADKLVNTVQKGEQQFIFWHLMLPHPPYIFHSDGTCRKTAIAEKTTPGEYKMGFREQVEYANALLTETFDRVKQKSSRKFIFVIQSDEGPFPWSYLNNLSLDWENVSIGDLRMKYGNLNAMYFPDQDYADLAGETTAINNFRHIFNRTLGTNLPMLENRSITFKSDRTPYVFIDVTKRLIPEQPPIPNN